MTHADTPSAIKAQARSSASTSAASRRPTGMPELARLHDWVARGYAGEMRYLARSADVRADVPRFLPGARSVIVTATNYNTGPDRRRRRAPAVGRPLRVGRRLSRRAAGAARRAARVDADAADAAVRGRGVRRQARVQERVFAAYAGPRLDRQEHAAHQRRARLVAVSRPASRRRCRSTPDAPVADQCGTCTLCLDACPDRRHRRAGASSTRAVHLLPDHRARRRRCPTALRRPSAGHVYGCDICQEVCPWNPRRRRPPIRRGSRGPAATRPTPVELWRRPDDALHDVRRRQRADARADGAAAAQPRAGARRRRRRPRRRPRSTRPAAA